MTKAVVEIEVSLSPMVGVGAVGFPVKAGLAKGALAVMVAMVAALTEATTAPVVGDTVIVPSMLVTTETRPRCHW